jgi:hypothetical protein
MELQMTEDLEIEREHHFFINDLWKFRKGKIYPPSIKKHLYTKNNYFERIEKKHVTIK